MTNRAVRGATRAERDVLRAVTGESNAIDHEVYQQLRGVIAATRLRPSHETSPLGH